MPGSRTPLLVLLLRRQEERHERRDGTHRPPHVQLGIGRNPTIWRPNLGGLLGQLGDQRGDTGIIYADERQTGLVCINGGMRQVQSGYHPTRQAALADARDIASRFDELVAGKS